MDNEKAMAYWGHKIKDLEHCISEIELQDETTRFFKKEYLEFLKKELEEAYKEAQKYSNGYPDDIPFE